MQKLADKSISREDLYKAVTENFDLLPQLLIGVSSPKARVRYGCSSVLMQLSEKYPQKICPYTDQFVALLGSKHRILVWNGLTILANLCAVDEAKRFDALFDRYFGFIDDEYLVTVANVVGNAGKIASAKPYFIPKITTELLKVESIPTTPHLTNECKRVLAEHAIKSFDEFFDKMAPDDKAKVLSFAKRQVGSSRETLSLQADAFLKRWSA